MITNGTGSFSQAFARILLAKDLPRRLVIFLRGKQKQEAMARELQRERLAAEFQCPVELSDHTFGIEVSNAAVALGSCFIEKHFPLRQSDGGPDSAFSLEPDEMAALVGGANRAFEALGADANERAAAERASMAFCRSVAVRGIEAGEEFTSDNNRVIRPGFGLPPKELHKLLGRCASKRIGRGTRMSWYLAA